MDFTDKFNTQLSPAKEAEFQAWAKKNSRAGDLTNYDMRGAWLSKLPQSDNGHYPDTFKKPNHPTFSTESQYSGQGGYSGGEWVKAPDGHWVFAAAPTNLQFHGAEGLTDYFRRFEPGNSLIYSEGQ